MRSSYQFSLLDSLFPIIISCDILEIKRGHFMDYKVNNMVVEKEFKICPSCGYKDGFHSMFRKQGVSTKWLFICPSCHAVFDIGYTV
jgi:hypothetical protein